MQRGLIQDRTAEQCFTLLKVGHGQVLQPIPVWVKQAFDAESIVDWIGRSGFTLVVI